MQDIQNIIVIEENGSCPANLNGKVEESRVFSADQRHSKFSVRVPTDIIPPQLCISPQKNCWYMIQVLLSLYSTSKLN
jgi:hypothetical protein